MMYTKCPIIEMSLTEYFAAAYNVWNPVCLAGVIVAWCALFFLCAYYGTTVPPGLAATLDISREEQKERYKNDAGGLIQEAYEKVKLLFPALNGALLISCWHSSPTRSSSCGLQKVEMSFSHRT